MKPDGPKAGPRIHAAAFHGAWIVLLLGSAWWRFSFPLIPAIDRDYRGFVNPALLALAGGPFEHMIGRNILYPGMIYGLLSWTQDLRSIAILQHTLGLATGGLLLATWCAASRTLRPTHLPRWLSDAMGLGMFAVFLFMPHPVHFVSFAPTCCALSLPR